MNPVCAQHNCGWCNCEGRKSRLVRKTIGKPRRLNGIHNVLQYMLTVSLFMEQRLQAKCPSDASAGIRCSSESGWGRILCAKAECFLMTGRDKKQYYIMLSSISVARKKRKDAGTPPHMHSVHGWVISERMHPKPATWLVSGQRDWELVWEGSLNFTACSILPLSKKSIWHQLYSFFRK